MPRSISQLLQRSGITMGNRLFILRYLSTSSLQQNTSHQ